MGKATEPTKASSTRMANADEQARPKKKARIEAGQCLYDPGTPLTKPGAWEDPPESKHGDRERSHPVIHAVDTCSRSTWNMITGVLRSLSSSLLSGGSYHTPGFVGGVPRS